MRKEAKIWAPKQENMPNIGFGGYDAAFQTVVILVALAVLVVLAYVRFGSGPVCDTELVRNADGTLTLRPSGKVFADMNAFQQWFHTSGTVQSCPLPVLEDGEREIVVTGDTWGAEQTYARTPIYKVDDYEFSRIFGYERAGRMVVPRQNFNMILEERTFDWADRPLTSDERRGKYAGLREGFTAAGDLESQLVRDAVAQYRPAAPAKPEDVDCKLSREAREVAKLVSAAYANEPNWEPVVTKVGANHWEVNELKPRRRLAEPTVIPVSDSVVNTANENVDIEFRYREREVQQAAIDPYFVSIGSLPYTYDRPSADPYYGPVPGMERMMGPTFDRVQWY